jgi:hypothetical protein
MRRTKTNGVNIYTREPAIEKALVEDSKENPPPFLMKRLERPIAKAAITSRYKNI